MYTIEERQALLDDLVESVKQSPVFEGLLLIGSGVQGYSDIYSDIDLMAGCTDLENAESVLLDYFTNKDAFHIERRSWSRTVLGLSAYFENGLSVDISFMPSVEIPLRTKYWKILDCKSKHFSDLIEEKDRSIPEQTIYLSQHSFFFALRRMEIALCRKEFVYAEMALSDARNQLLTYEIVKEDKKIHQFKAYNSLDPSFLKKLYRTYPTEISEESLRTAQNNLIKLFEDTEPKVDQIQRGILYCLK